VVALWCVRVEFVSVSVLRFVLARLRVVYLQATLFLDLRVAMTFRRARHCCGGTLC
jgi:hypothetical protein